MSMTSSITPTAEQQAILDTFRTGDNMVIEAGAGTGKTSTLRMIAESCPDKQGLFVAYNKAIQTDAEGTFPATCECRTSHSLAYQGTKNLPNGPALLARLRGPRVPSRQLVSLLGVPTKFQVSPDQEIPAWIIARSAMEAVKRFCSSADDEIQWYHVPKIDGLENQRGYREFVVKFARKAWADLNQPRGGCKFDHDHYLKIWALSRPQLRADYILFDEAQDANPVIAKLVEDQDSQQVMVGDRNQAIYGWRGAEDAMTKFETTHRLYLSQSFRFGPAVATEANKFLELLEAPMRLTGFDKIPSKVEAIEKPNVILCRTNATVIANAMSAQAEGRSVAIVGGTKEISYFTEQAAKLMSGESASHPDLVAFKSWGEVQQYAQSDEGEDLRVWVKLIETYGVEDILAVCRNSVGEGKADLIVSTAHKAKGREWDHVRIANDFKAPEEGATPSNTEMMLLYVVTTRARLTLDRTAIAWIDEVQAPVMA